MDIQPMIDAPLPRQVPRREKPAAVRAGHDIGIVVFGAVVDAIPPGAWDVGCPALGSLV